MPVGIVETAENNLTRPYGGVNPFGPAGFTDTTRQGWATQLGGIGGQMPNAQAYAANMGGQAGQSAGAFNQGMASGQFSGNPYMGGAANLNYGAPNVAGWDQARMLAGNAPNRPGFGRSAGMVNNTMDQYGGGWSSGLANTVNQTGASFNPWNPMLGQMAGAANAQLGKDFRQNTMPQLNKDLVGAGPGAYGGTRAGVAQGMREQSLADAMQRQTTGIFGSGYEAGLGRYVSDRANTLSTVNNAMQTGGNLGMAAAQQYGNLGQMRGQLMNESARNIGNFANQRGGVMNESARNLGNMGLTSMGANNEMFRFGHGSLLPQGIRNTYQAGQAPGQVQQNYGRAMTGIGGIQQQQNQNNLDWMNNRYNAQQSYPDTRLNNYAGMIGPYMQPGQVQPQQVGQVAPATNPWSTGLGGAMAGYGAYDAYRSSQPAAAGWAGPPAGTNPSYRNPVPGPLAPNTYGWQ